MPKFRFALFSHRNRPITDLVDTFILNGQRVGPVRDARDLKPTHMLFTVDAPPDKYELQLEVDGFKLYRRTVEIKQNAPPSSGSILRTSAPTCRNSTNSTPLNGRCWPASIRDPTRKSHREKDRMPRLQIVLSDDNAHADVDLDVEFDRSSPHHVFGHFIKRFPEVEGICQF